MQQAKSAALRWVQRTSESFTWDREPLFQVSLWQPSADLLAAFYRTFQISWSVSASYLAVRRTKRHPAAPKPSWRCCARSMASERGSCSSQLSRRPRGARRYRGPSEWDPARSSLCRSSPSWRLKALRAASPSKGSPDLLNAYGLRACLRSRRAGASWRFNCKIRYVRVRKSLLRIELLGFQLGDDRLQPN